MSSDPAAPTLPPTTYTAPVNPDPPRQLFSLSEHVVPRPTAPVLGRFPAQHMTIGCGAAIFHVGSGRVVVCYHERDKYWFLPKGRRNAGEESGPAAEREAYEESGYPNRLLPLPLLHRQPYADHDHQPDVSPPQGGPLASIRTTEPVWTELIPSSRRSLYLLFWYISETLPPSDAAPAPSSTGASSVDGAPNPPPYVPPRAYPVGLTLRERLSLEPAGYVPPKHAGTAVNEEETWYRSELLPVAEAAGVLRGTVMADVVVKGWRGIVELGRSEGLEWGREGWRGMERRDQR